MPPKHTVFSYFIHILNDQVATYHISIKFGDKLNLANCTESPNLNFANIFLCIDFNTSTSKMLASYFVKNESLRLFSFVSERYIAVRTAAEKSQPLTGLLVAWWICH